MGRLLLLVPLLASCTLTPPAETPPEAPLHRSAPHALGPYSGSVEAGGFVFLAGKIGTTGGGFRREVHSALDAVEAELARAGRDLGDLVSVTVYLTDMALYGVFNEVYAARVPAPYPARACVAVRSLPAGATVEIVGLAR